MELTKVCVELVWRLCFSVKIWIDFKLWFYSYFWGDFGIDCRMFYAVFLACFVLCLCHVLWPQLEG